MNQATMRTSLALGLTALALASAPANADRYLIEPATDAHNTVEAVAFTQAELDQMLAPIALFPDSLLSQVLIAATYPLEIVEAVRWSRQNLHLRGEEAVAAAAGRGWDPSVLALLAFPDVLAQMDQDLEWTRRVGDAMLYQETQVMDSIQFLRARADAAGSLESTEFTRVIRQERTIIIEPAQTHIVHVPFYDPWIAFGPWWRPIHPPVVWARPSFVFWGHPGFFWGPAVHVSPGFWFSSFHWPQRNVVIVNVPRHYSPPRHFPAKRFHAPGQRWTHNPAHRRGVAYRHPGVKDRYRPPALRPGPAASADNARQPGRVAAAPDTMRQTGRVATTQDRVRPTVSDTQAQLRQARRDTAASDTASRPSIAGRPAPRGQGTAAPASSARSYGTERSTSPPRQASAAAQPASPPPRASASERNSSPAPAAATSREDSRGSRAESRGARSESHGAGRAPRAEVRGASPERDRR